jgi:hypothetical protein
MFHYLVDQQDRVLLQVSGPLKLKPGQRLVPSEVKVSTKLARYDPETDSIVRAPASQFAKVKRDAKRRRKERDSSRDEAELELSQIIKKDPHLGRALELLVRLPRRRVLSAIASAREGEEA